MERGLKPTPVPSGERVPGRRSGEERRAALEGSPAERGAAPRVNARQCRGWPGAGRPGCALPGERWGAGGLDGSARGKAMQKPMEKSQNFRIEALLAEEPARSASPPGLSPGSPAASPGPAGRSDTPSPRGPPAAAPLAPAGFVPKPGLLHLSGPGLGALPALYSPAVYPLPTLGGQHPAFAYTGIPHLPPPGAEHLKAAVAGSLPLEHWIRAGMLVPRLSDFNGE